MYWIYDIFRETSAWRTHLLEHIYVYNVSWGDVQEFLMYIVIDQYSNQKPYANIKALSFFKELSQ